MDILNTWSLKLAEEVAPDEIDLAPLMTQAFVKGGGARAELFDQARTGALGGFGAGEMAAIFPAVLKSVAVAAPVLSAMLAASPHLKDFSAIVKDLAEVAKGLKKPASPALSSGPYAPLKRAIDALSQELQSVRVPQEQRDLIAYRVLRAMLEEPAGAAQFVQKIGAANA